MNIRELAVGGAYEVVPSVHEDDRGAFLEWFRAEQFQATTGHPFNLAQANASVSAAGTIRGIHFADVPPSQAKWVTCLYGAVLDVVVDIRVGSPTFGRCDSVLLDDEGHRATYISEGLGHAFMSLVDRSVVTYLCSAPYSPGREHGINPLDPSLEIHWPTSGRDGAPLTPVLSNKDAAAPSLAEAETAGLLPLYTVAQDFVASLGG